MIRNKIYLKYSNKFFLYLVINLLIYLFIN
jgi:hypothetical protein